MNKMISRKELSGAEIEKRIGSRAVDAIARAMGIHVQSLEDDRVTSLPCQVGLDLAYGAIQFDVYALGGER